MDDILDFFKDLERKTVKGSQKDHDKDDSGNSEEKPQDQFLGQGPSIMDELFPNRAPTPKGGGKGDDFEM